MSNIIISPQSGVIEFNTGVAGCDDSFHTSTAPIRLDATGGNIWFTGSNVGIGTTDPQFTLDVEGAIHGTSGNFSTAITVGGNPVMTGASPEADTLQTVTSRGNTTTTDIKVAHISGSKLSLSQDNIIDSNGEILDFQANDLIANSKHIRAEFGIWARSAGGRNMGIDGNDHGDFMQLYTNGTEKVRITQVGNVGIGTSTPDDALTIVGTSADFSIRKADNNLAARIVQFSAGGGQLRLYDTGSNETVRLAGDGSNSFITGNLGIGTTSPSSALEVRGGSIDIGTNDIKGAANSKIEMDAADGFTLTNPNNAHGVDIVADDLTFFGGGLGNRKITTNAGDLSIDPTADLLLNETAGNVGIGTDSPSTKFHLGSGIARFQNAGSNYIEVDGSVASANIARISSRFNRFEIVTNAGAGDPDISLMPAAGGNVGIGNNAPAEALSISTAAEAKDNNIDFLVSNSYNAGLLFRDPAGGRGSIISNTDNDLIFSTNGTGISAETMRIDSDGNVGIGTDSPDLSLSVAGSSQNQAIFGQDRTSGVSSIYVGSEASTNKCLAINYDNANNKAIFNIGGDYSSSPLVIDDGGKVGIGTTTPSQTLHVKGIGIIEDASSTSFGTLQFGTDTSRYVRGNSAEIQFGSTIQQLHFQKTNGPAQVASSAANGVTAIQLLARNVHTSANLLEVVNGNGQTADFVIDSAGNVGIGTTNPSSKLHVAGTASIDTLEYSSVVSVFGQSRIKLNELSDVFYKADLRFTVTGGSPSFFNGGFDQAGNLPTNTTNVINVNVAGQQGVPSNGITYPQGNVYISFYYTNHAYTAISLRHKSGGVYYSSTGTDVSTNSGYKVIKFPISTNNYLTDIEISITTDANLVKVAAINYLSDRWTTQLELPFVSKYLTSNTVFGEFGISGVSASSGPHLRLEGTYTTWELENQYTGGATNDMFRIRNTQLGSDALVINRLNNNVGIGTTNPSTKLQVAGTSQFDDNLNVANSTLSITAAAPNMLFVVPSGGLDSRIYNDGSGNFIIGHGTNSNNPTERLRINSSGNVGIGTNSPAEKLHVNGEVRVDANEGIATKKIRSSYFSSSQNLYLQSGASGDIILTSDKVGIGATSPQEKLDISGGNIRLDDGQRITWSTADANIGRVRIVGNESSDFLAFTTDNSERLRIDSSGKVGIGTTSPTAPLHLYQPSSTGMKFGRSGHDTIELALEGSNRFVINNDTDSSNLLTLMFDSGNVGIGTTGPASKLHVDGTVQVGVDDTGYDVKFYGNDSGEYMEWDASNARLNILHTDESAGLQVFTNAQVQTTQPQIKIGRSSNQYWGAYVDDRNAHLVHRQDETSGNMTTRFDQWDSNTSDNNGSWLWRVGNGSGASMQTAMTLTQAGDLTLGGSLTLGGTGRIQGIDTVSSGTDATSKTYVDNAITSGLGSYLPLAGGTLTGNLTIAKTDPTITLYDNSGANTDPNGTIIFSEVSNTTNFDINYNGADDRLEFRGRIGSTLTDLVHIKRSLTNTLQVLGTVTVDGGNITLGGTGRIQGIDTVTDSTDAANKAYVDAQVGSADTLQEVTDNGNTFSADLLYTNSGTAQKIDNNHYNGLMHFNASRNVGFQASTADIAHIHSFSETHFKFGSSHNSANTTTMLIKSDGDVGIGTTGPSSRLHISSARTTERVITESTNTSAYVGYRATNGSGYWEMQVDGSNQGLRWLDDGSERMRIDSSGNVGIGTTNPANQLHVVGTRIRLDSNAGGFYKYTGGGGFRFALYDDSSKTHLFADGDGSNPHMTFNAGFVGIATEDPQQELHVKGAALRLEEASGSRHLDIVPAVSGQHHRFTSTNTGAGYIFEYWNGSAATAMGSITSTGLTVNSGNISLGGTGRIQGIDTVTDSTDAASKGYVDSQVGSATLQEVTDNGNTTTNSVGIGTTSPSAKLDVSVTSGAAWMSLINGSETAFRLTTYNNGTSNGSNAYAFKHGLYYNTTENAAVTFYRGGSSTGGFLTFTTNAGNERMRIDTNGNVGIGTTNPIANLHVDGDVQVGNSNNPNAFGALQVNQATNVDEAGIGVLSASAGRSIRIWVDETRSYINSGNGGGGILVLNEGAGNVGIGTTGPTNKLEIKGSGGGTDVLNLNKGTGEGGIKFTFDGTNYVSYIRTKEFSTVADNYMALGVSNGNNTTGAEVMRLKGDGNVGIGTTSPSTKLEVAATATTSVDIAHFSNSNGVVKINHSLDGVGSGKISILDASNNEDIRLSAHGDSWFNAGKVGIGTTSPTFGKLEVYGNGANTTIAVHEDAGTHEARLHLRRGGSDWEIINNSDLAFEIESSEIARFKTNGNVGIGTATPDSRLDVTGGDITINTSGAGFMHFKYGSVGSESTVGTITTDGIDLRINSVADTIFQPTGNVGIGTITPNEKLEVNGSVRVGNVKIQNANGGRIGLNRNTSTGAIYNNTFGAFQIQNNDTTGFEIQGYNTGGSLTGLISMKQSDGYVGIGIASPTTKFHIDDNATAGTGLLVTGGGVGGPLAKFTRDVGGSGSVEISSRDSRPQIKLAASSNTFALGVNGSTFEIADNTTLGTNARLSITNTGNVGIGTTSPTATLDIKGDGAEIYLKSADYSVARIIPRGTGSNLDKGLLSLFDTGTEDVRIDTAGNSWFNGGNVGI